MPNNDQNGTVFPRIYTIHSQKGGVGKTSIAIALAGIAAIWYDKNALIIDADLTGTSLIDLEGWGGKANPKYFNELILAKPRQFSNHTSVTTGRERRSARFCHHMRPFYHELPLNGRESKVRFMTASPVFEDIRKVVPLISQEDHLHFFRHRMEDIILAAVADEFDVIIIDHPPGLYGISLASLRIVLKQIVAQHKMAGGRGDDTRLDRLYRMVKGVDAAGSIATRALLVTSTDSADYRALFPYFNSIIEEYPVLKKSISDPLWPVDIIVNKAHAERNDLVPIIPRILRDLTNFHDNRQVEKYLIDAFEARQTKLGDALASPYDPNFKITDIMLTIESVKGDTKKEYAGMRGWVKQLAKALGLSPVPHPPSLGIELKNE